MTVPKYISVQEFLELFKKAAPTFTWFNRRSDVLRGLNKNGSYFCPVTAVAYVEKNKFFAVDKYIEAGNAIGLRSRDVYAIMAAADCDREDKDFSEVTREALLKNV